MAERVRAARKVEEESGGGEHDGRWAKLMVKIWLRLAWPVFVGGESGGGHGQQTAGRVYIPTSEVKEGEKKPGSEAARTRIEIHRSCRAKVWRPKHQIGCTQ